MTMTLGLGQASQDDTVINASSKDPSMMEDTLCELRLLARTKLISMEVYRMLVERIEGSDHFSQRESFASL